MVTYPSIVTEKNQESSKRTFLVQVAMGASGSFLLVVVGGFFLGLFQFFSAFLDGGDDSFGVERVRIEES